MLEQEAPAVVANLRAAYADLDSLAYAAVLAPGFRFYFAPEDVTDHDLLTDHMTRAEVLQSAYNQFSGELVDQPGAVEAAVSAIHFTRLEPVEDWKVADAASGFPGAQRRIYDVEIDGISLLFTYKNTFSEELQSETLDALIARMKHKNASFHPGAGN